jgi:probable rRNA maturation factor
VAAISLDVTIDSALWQAEPQVETVICGAIEAAAEVVRALPGAAGEVSVVLTDDARIRALNREWRDIDKPTNVLSFPAPGGRTAAEPALLGDVVIAYETTAREAAAEAKPFTHHIAHLVVHGFLHLLGYDHESDTEADQMERLETRILALLAVPDPYGPQQPEA